MSSKSKTPAKKPAAKPVAKPAAKQAQAPAPTKVQQNGITRPGEGTICAKVWATLDKLRAKGEETTATGAMDLLKDINPATVRTQTQRWREYHGITRDTKKPPRKSDKPAAAKGALEVQAA